ncbi:hypothetical protein N7494_008747 [Penicillium frequentans]|uniref:Zn(2)-C6 fungal-type domain-containing protein n=1 Tax=Penicillium frequentans TaxID=3151616 RepID=A0AAD6CNP7_9EURO|nr:hypothetical protein N7494_008747 [Penicillium glabrum]
MQSDRKRRVRTCYPCYTRKKKCNREYPCNHCTHRRRPEECVYSFPPTEKTSQNSVRPVGLMNEARAPFLEHARPSRENPALNEPEGHWSSPHSALTKSFGYFEGSNSNTMALLRTLELPAEGETDPSDSSPSIWETIQQELGPMVGERKPIGVAYVEFAALILRICSYATQFLPSPTHTIDQIGGRPLADIRDTCSDIGRNLAKLCESLDWKGSLFRVQHILFAALKVSCEGRTDQFWEGIASASRAAQKAGVHTDTALKESLDPSNGSARELHKEVRRRVFCSLYVLDSHLSRQLDRVPFLPDDLVVDSLPRLRLIPDIGNISAEANARAPDIFTERLMQVRLGQFWRRFVSPRNSEYDPTGSEQRYDKLCGEYLPSLHAAFAIDHPDTAWDNVLPKLPMQRQLLYIAIFDSVCWNFRPLLLLKPDFIAGLAPYKRVLLQSQKQRLAIAALKELEAVTALHSMFGGSYTRFAAIIFNTFEAAILLLSLCSHVDFPFDQGDANTNILGIQAKLTYKKAMQAAEQAIGRLQMLAELSDMAAAGARVAAQVFAKAAKSKEPTSPVAPAGLFDNSFWQFAHSADIGAAEDLGPCLTLEQADPVLMSDIFSSTAQEDSYPKLPLSSFDFPMV